MNFFKTPRNVLLRLAVNAQVNESPSTTASKKRGTLIATAVMVGGMCAMPAMAGTGGDALFKDTYDSTMGAVQGYGAKLATGVSGAFAMIGSVFKFQPQLIATTLGVGFTGAGVDSAVDFTVTGLI